MTTNGNRPRWGNQRGGRGGNNGNNGHTQHSRGRAGGQPVYSEDGRHTVGYIVPDTFCIIFRKYVHSTKGHMVQKPRKGWALELHTLRFLEAHDSPPVVVIDQDTGINYRADVADFPAHGYPVDRGQGAQLCLPLEFWSIDGQPPRAAEVEAQDSGQLSLW